MEHALPPLPYDMDALAPHISRAVTGTVLHVDNGMHIMGISLDSKAFDDSPTFKAFRAKKTPASDWTHP